MQCTNATVIKDEATSSIDTQTDAQVQEVIQREFVKKGVTVITVAHRLETVLGYDNILVLGNGEKLEYGPPKKLLENDGVSSASSGHLRQLVEADKKKKNYDEVIIMQT
mmetsp:Transcript_28805/g.65908  ORF Transcript_28805/g.65908 Transcript_28805/m.65908 type:complete len:109 (+) Transcript_28805:2509-2835(+)